MTRRKSSAGVVTLLALSATFLSPVVLAARSLHGKRRASLRTAIDNANADSDPSATITLTGDISFASATAFPAPTKPITLNTNGFGLTVKAESSPKGSRFPAAR